MEIIIDSVISLQIVPVPHNEHCHFIGQLFARVLEVQEKYLPESTRIKLKWYNEGVCREAWMTVEDKYISVLKTPNDRWLDIHKIVNRELVIGMKAAELYSIVCRAVYDNADIWKHGFHYLMANKQQGNYLLNREAISVKESKRNLEDWAGIALEAAEKGAMVHIALNKKRISSMNAAWNPILLLI